MTKIATSFLKVKYCTYQRRGGGGRNRERLCDGKYKSSFAIDYAIDITIFFIVIGFVPRLSLPMVVCIWELVGLVLYCGTPLKKH